MFRVMLRDDIADLARKILEETGKIEVVVDNDPENLKPERLIKIASSFDGVAVRGKTKFYADVLEKATRLKVIGRAGTGVDNIDLQAATRKGIVVMNAPGGNTITTAEHSIAMLLAIARNIPQGTMALKEGRWEKKKLAGVELTGKVLGIIGLGKIGKEVAKLALGLKMKVIASDPYVGPEAARAMGIRLVSMDELLAEADFVTLHVPKMKETINLIDEKALSKMKPSARLINCSRGEVVDLEALYSALTEGRIAGAAIDVLPKEPPDPDLPILSLPNVILTPHLGASTREAQLNVAEMIARQMAAYFTDGIITNAVNFPSVPKELADSLYYHIDLAEKMGSIIGQLVRKAHDITITYAGEISGYDTRPLTHAALKGLLQSFTDTPVNYVSAPILAEEKGIRVREVNQKTAQDYSSLISIKLEDSAYEISEIRGTVFGRKYQKIVRLGKISTDAIPDGHMIVIQNIDRPGVIGNIGTTLGRHDINIARFQLGRRNDRAICIVNVDTPADDAVIEELKNLPNIIDVRQVEI